VVSVDLEDFGNVSASGPTFDLNHDVQQIGDVGLDGPKAKVNPETTIATRERPRAIVLVKACCKTPTAFSQGEFA
jgi:hypothetical protein